MNWLSQCREAHEAARRLLKSLPVREHRIGTDADNTGRPIGPRALTFNGTEYASVQVAATALGISRAYVYRMIADGRAEYVS